MSMIFVLIGVTRANHPDRRFFFSHPKIGLTGNHAGRVSHRAWTPSGQYRSVSVGGFGGLDPS